MTRSRADEVLEGWKSVAHGAAKPAVARVGGSRRSAVPAGLLGTAAVLLLVLGGLYVRGGGAGPRASASPFAGGPAATASALAPASASASSGAIARPLTLSGTARCDNYGACREYVNAYRLDAGVSLPGWGLPLGWEFGTSGSGPTVTLIQPADAPTTIEPGDYMIWAWMDWVSDVAIPSESPQVGTYAECQRQVTIDESSAPVAIVVTFDGSTNCTIDVQQGGSSATPTHATPSSTPRPTMPSRTISPLSVEMAQEFVITYTQDLVSGIYSEAWAKLAPESQDGWGSFDAFVAERKAFFESVAGQYKVTAQPPGFDIIDWLPKDVSIDWTNGVLVEVDYPNIASPAGWELFIVMYGADGPFLYVVR